MLERFLDLYRGELEVAYSGFVVVLLSFLFRLFTQFFCLVYIIIVFGIRLRMKLLQCNVKQAEVRIVVSIFVCVFQRRRLEGMVER